SSLTYCFYLTAMSTTQDPNSNMNNNCATLESQSTTSNSNPNHSCLPERNDMKPVGIQPALFPGKKRVFGNKGHV
ncbi:unnamed protein product, partial [Rotaria sp. Silwood1]